MIYIFVKEIVKIYVVLFVAVATVALEAPVVALTGSWYIIGIGPNATLGPRISYESTIIGSSGLYHVLYRPL